MKMRIGISALALCMSSAGAFAQAAPDTPLPKAPPEIVAPSDKAPPGPGHTPEMERPMASQMDRFARPDKRAKAERTIV